MRRGHIYILINGCMPGLVMIGHTWESPQERAREFSQATAVPVPFTLVCDEEVILADEAASVIHVRLEKYRFERNREFFTVPLKEAIRVVKEVAGEYRERERMERANPDSRMEAAEREPPPAAENAKRSIKRQVLTRIGVGLFLGPICAIYAWGFGLSNIGGVLLLLLAVFYFGAVLAAPFFQQFACPICGSKSRVTYFTKSSRCGKCGVTNFLDES